MIKFKKLYEGAVIPARATDGSAGFDLVARHSAKVMPLMHEKIYTGISVNVGKGNVGLVCPRSGLAARHRITVLNAPGIIDSDFRGEVGVLLQNMSVSEFHVEAGMRIAQLVIVPCITDAVVVDELDATARGDGGFGSTGA